MRELDVIQREIDAAQEDLAVQLAELKDAISGKLECVSDGIDKVRGVARTTEGFVQREPFGVACAALAIGFALGWLGSRAG